MESELAVGIDLGGTNLKAALVDHQGRILSKLAGPAAAERGAEPVIAEMVAFIDRLLRQESLNREDLAGVGIGSPGPLDLSKGRIARAANLPGWDDVPVRDMLRERLNLPVTLDNDGNAAAFGEYWAGAGRGCDDMVMLTLGTGVGAGVIIGGRVLHGHFDNAAELGHTIVAANGLRCACGQRGCLEQYASAAAVARRVVAAIEEGESSAVGEAVGGVEAIDAKHVASAAGAGDALCERIWDEACLYLAIACVNIQHAFNPARIVLGGGMAEAGNFLFDRVNSYVREQTWSLHNDAPTVAAAQLGYDAGVIGAAGLAWQGDRA